MFSRKDGLALTRNEDRSCLVNDPILWMCCILQLGAIDNLDMLQHTVHQQLVQLGFQHPAILGQHSSKQPKLYRKYSNTNQ